MDNYHSPKIFFLKRKKRKKTRQAQKFAVYNYYLIGITSIPILLAGIFNWLIDPQDIFKTPNYWQLNHQKIKKDNNDRLFKAVDVIRLQPKTVVIGSSRTKQGIDPKSSVFKERQNVYNLALNGPNFYEIRRYIEHAIYNQPDLEQIILGIDFFMFNQNLNNQPTFKESRLEKKQIVISDLIQNLFSIDTLKTSFDVVRASQESPETMKDRHGDDGFMPNRNFNNGATIWRFHQSINLYFNLHSDYQFSQAYWQDFREIVKLCQQNNIKLTVFISPSHATHWESIYVTNKWEVFEQWKRELAKIVSFWDFSGYNSITTEPIAKHMQNYVDNSHYTPDIGDMILQRILESETDKIPLDFGTIVDGKNIEIHLEKIKSDRQKWIRNNPEELELVRNFYARINQKQTQNQNE